MTFISLGIDVNAEALLVVMIPLTGVELTGADAVQKTIADKRLTAIWQRAGKRSMAFRVAQIKVAKSHYWPADDTVYHYREWADCRRAKCRTSSNRRRDLPHCSTAK